MVPQTARPSERGLGAPHDAFAAFLSFPLITAFSRVTTQRANVAQMVFPLSSALGTPAPETLR